VDVGVGSGSGQEATGISKDSRNRRRIKEAGRSRKFFMSVTNSVIYNQYTYSCICAELIGQNCSCKMVNTLWEEPAKSTGGAVTRTGGHHLWVLVPESVITGFGHRVAEPEPVTALDRCN
jgi:hypothetical protein